MLDAREFGDRITLTVRRGEQRVEVPITLGRHAAVTRALKGARPPTSQALPHLDLIAHLPRGEALDGEPARALLFFLGGDLSVKVTVLPSSSTLTAIGREPSVASERKLAMTAVSMLASSRCATAVGFIRDGHDERVRDGELVDDALDAVDFACELLGALAIGFRAHRAVERGDAVADERAQSADVELLGEPCLHLEAELRVADVDALACSGRRRSAAGVRSGSVRLRGRSGRAGRE